MENCLKAKGIKIFTGSRIQQIEQHGSSVSVTVLQGKNENSIRGDLLFFATGLRQNTEELGLKKVGVEQDKMDLSRSTRRCRQV